MKNKGFIVLVMAVVIITTGCRLAREDAGQNANADRLIGVLITTEYLDLFDMEGYLNDNISGFSGGKIVVDDRKSGKYQGRLYATLVEREYSDEVSGNKTVTGEYVFENIKGIPFFAATVPFSEGRETYVTTGSDESISDGHSGLYYGDEEDRIELEGTIYITPTYSGQTYFLNPVYQSSDGDVFALSGGGYNLSGVKSEGAVFSQTLDETTDISENGKKKSFVTSVEISLAAMFPPDKIVINQVDKNNGLLSTNEFTPNEMAEELILMADVEYIVVETYKTDSDGNKIIDRDIYGKKDGSFATFYLRDDGVCVKKWTGIRWSD